MDNYANTTVNTNTNTIINTQIQTHWQIAAGSWRRIVRLTERSWQRLHWSTTEHPLSVWVCNLRTKVGKSTNTNKNTNENENTNSKWKYKYRQTDRQRLDWSTSQHPLTVWVYNLRTKVGKLTLDGNVNNNFGPKSHFWTKKWTFGQNVDSFDSQFHYNNFQASGKIYVALSLSLSMQALNLRPICGKLET